MIGELLDRLDEPVRPGTISDGRDMLAAADAAAKGLLKRTEKASADGACGLTNWLAYASGDLGSFR